MTCMYLELNAVSFKGYANKYPNILSQPIIVRCELFLLNFGFNYRLQKEQHIYNISNCFQLEYQYKI